MSVWFLEVLDEDGRVRERRRLEEPLTAGRSYADGLVLDDPAVSAGHARLEPRPEGGWTVSDQGSLNGLRRPGRPERPARIDLADGDSFLLGRTTLRVRSSDFPVPPAVPLAMGGDDRRTAAFAVAAWAAFLATVVGGMILQEYEEADLARQTGPLILAAAGLAIGGTAWAGLWTVASRLSSGRRAFWTHMAVAGAAGLASVAGSALSSWTAFALGRGELLGWLAAAAVTSAQWTAHLRAGVLSTTRRAATAGLLASALFWGTCGAAAYFFEKRFSPRPRFDETVRPAWARLVPPRAPEDWSSRFADLRRRSDEDARRDSAT